MDEITLIVECPDCRTSSGHKLAGKLTQETRFICPKCRRGFQISGDVFFRAQRLMNAREGYLTAWSRASPAD